MPTNKLLRRRVRKWLISAMVIGCLLLFIAIFYFNITINAHHLAWMIILLEALLIINIQQSRLRHKRNKKALAAAHNDLEQRVSERTNKLRTINNQLYNEIAKHKSTESRLRETENYLHSIINSMPSVVIGVTHQGQITHWNSAAYNATNLKAEEALNKDLLTVFPSIPVTYQLIQNAIESGTPYIKENLEYGDTDNKRLIDLAVYPLNSKEQSGAVIRLNDITLRVRMENMMMQSEKMMSLGELSAGMAHEVNNPLTAILNSIQNIKRRTSAELAKNRRQAEEIGISMQQLNQYLLKRGLYSFFDIIQEAGERAAKIVNNMLEFSHTSSTQHQKTDITKLLLHTVDLAANSFGLRARSNQLPVTIQQEFYPNLPQIYCSPTELQQVFMNLIRNACQAFQTTPGLTSTPTLILRTRADNTHIFIEIADNGPGMSETVSRHIFEPFFTTKETGQGTGLGLSICYFIITEHHHGSIEVESQPDMGTTFIITLPIQSSTPNSE